MKTVESAPICIIVDCDQTTQRDSQACNEHVSTSEYKRIVKQREYRMVNLIAKKTGLAEDVVTVLENVDVSQPVADLLEGLAALCDMADANRSVPTDAGRRSASRSEGVPSFDPAAAERELKAAANRIQSEVEKVFGVTRQPWKSPEPECSECERRPRVVDVLCGPCAAQVLREHRRQPLAVDGQRSRI